jgi:beta-mannanase
MLTLNKPIVIGEVGPKTINGQFEYSLWLDFLQKNNIFICVSFRPNAIKNKYPKISHFLIWSGP